jgi:hypothetical protein
MDQDEKRARAPGGARAPRSTAPAGTPYPVAPPSPAPLAPVPAAAPPRPPAPTASQPRTVGGHTARLAVPEEDPLGFDSHASGSASMVVHDGPPISPPPELQPQAVGGTMRLATVSPDDVLVPSPAPQPPAPKPPAPIPRPPAPALERATGRAADDDGSSFLARLFAPVSVAVGLVFFAMGSMITLTAEGRLIQFSITASVPSSTSSAPAAPSSPAPSTAPAASTVVSAVSVGVAAIPPPAVTTAKPIAPPGVPGTVRPPGQTSKRPPLPFP